MRTTTPRSPLPSLVRVDLATVVALLAAASPGDPGDVVDRVASRVHDLEQAELARPFLLVLAAALPRPTEPTRLDPHLGAACADALTDTWRASAMVVDEEELLAALFAAYRAGVHELRSATGVSAEQAHRIVQALAGRTRSTTVRL